MIEFFNDSKFGNNHSLDSDIIKKIDMLIANYYSDNNEHDFQIGDEFKGLQNDDYIKIVHYLFLQNQSSLAVKFISYALLLNNDLTNYSHDEHTIKFPIGKMVKFLKVKYSLLTLVIEFNSNAGLQLLINKNVELDLLNEDGLSPLLYALSIRQLPCVKILLDNKVDINSAFNVYTPLTLAFQNNSINSIEYVDLLLQMGAEVNKANNNGDTPLHFAALDYSNKYVKILFEHGAEVNKANNNGNTPLHFAVKYHSSACIKILLEHGGKISESSNNSLILSAKQLDKLIADNSDELLNYLNNSKASDINIFSMLINRLATYILDNLNNLPETASNLIFNDHSLSPETKNLSDAIIDSIKNSNYLYKLFYFIKDEIEEIHPTRSQAYSKLIDIFKNSASQAQIKKALIKIYEKIELESRDDNSVDKIEVQNYHHKISKFEEILASYNLLSDEDFKFIHDYKANLKFIDYAISNELCNMTGKSDDKFIDFLVDTIKSPEEFSFGALTTAFIKLQEKYDAKIKRDFTTLLQGHVKYLIIGTLIENNQFNSLFSIDKDQARYIDEASLNLEINNHLKKKSKIILSEDLIQANKLLENLRDQAKFNDISKADIENIIKLSATIQELPCGFITFNLIPHIALTIDLAKMILDCTMPKQVSDLLGIDQIKVNLTKAKNEVQKTLPSPQTNPPEMDSTEQHKGKVSELLENPQSDSLMEETQITDDNVCKDVEKNSEVNPNAPLISSPDHLNTAEYQVDPIGIDSSH